MGAAWFFSAGVVAAVAAGVWFFVRRSNTKGMATTLIHNRDKCLFCRIADNFFGGPLLHSDTLCAAFADINPAGKTHLLVVPREHYDNIMQLNKTHIPLLKRMKQVGIQLATERGAVAEDLTIGFTRPPWNSVLHVHLHVVTRPLRGFFIRTIFLQHPWLFITVDDLIADLEQQT